MDSKLYRCVNGTCVAAVSGVSAGECAKMCDNRCAAKHVDPTRFMVLCIIALPSSTYIMMVHDLSIG